MKIPLSKPIKAHNETLSALEMREPCGQDIIDCGSPFSFDIGKGARRAYPDAKAIGAMIAQLCAIPPSSVGQLSAQDFNAAMAQILVFFGGETATTASNGTSS
jgi:hypothetical protein